VFDKRMRVRKAYMNIARRILGNNVPLTDYHKPGAIAWFSRLFGRG
jgi:septum formation inhibitor-activating ATPase MinD